MSEVIYNLFMMWHDNVCRSVRYVCHDVDMSDEDALKFLQEKVPTDLHKSREIELSRYFDREEYNARTRLRQEIKLYDEVFVKLDAGPQPMFVLTPVVDGIPKVEFKSNFGDPNIYLREDMTPDHSMDDWLLKYANGNEFRISELINDDYFLAIKQTFNSKHYVSSMKLLLSALDSLAYIEYGDANGKQSIFERWLTTYADLSHLGITPQELWELRNGLLHMTNLNSRLISKNKVRRISFHVGGKAFYERDGIHYFSFYELIQAIAQALGAWLQTYNTDPEKMVLFVQRYDLTISDSRLALYTGRQPDGTTVTDADINGLFDE